MALTSEQLALRKTAITGSEIAAVAGLSPYSNATDVWEHKLGLRQDDLSGNPNIIRGTLFEQPVLQWYEMLTGSAVQPQSTLMHPKHPLIMATPDGIAHKEGACSRVVEVKCPSWHTARHWGAPGTDEVPVHILPQLTFEMAVTGLDVADAVLFAGVEPLIYPVAYDPDFFDALREIAERFWRDHVLARIPPPPDASEQYGDFIGRYAPQKREDVLDLTENEEAQRYLRRLKTARETAELAGAEVLLCQNNLKALIGEYAHAKLDGARISWKNSKPVSRIQWKDVAKSANILPEIIEQHTKTSEPTRPFKVTWEK